MDKRGISAVVAMVLIILITLALVVILWVAIIPIINTQLFFAEECRKAQASLQIKSSCTLLENLTIQISRGAEEFNLQDIQIGGSNGPDSTALYLVSQIGAGPAAIPGLNEKRFYNWNITAFLTPLVHRVRAAAVITRKNKEHTCEPSPWIETPWCNRTINQLFPKGG